MIDSTALRGFPPVVYVPCVPTEADPGVLQVALRRTRDGRLALLAYSALDRLVEAIGPDTPWVLCDKAALQRIYAESPYDLLLRDVFVPQDRRAGGWHGV